MDTPEKETTPESTPVAPTPAQASTPPTPTTTVQMTDPFVGLDEKDGQIKDWVKPVPTHRATLEELTEIIKDYAIEVSKSMDEEDAKAAVDAFTKKLRSAYAGHWLRGEYSSFFDRPLAQLTQSVASETGAIRIQGQVVNTPKTPTGISAILALQNLMGVGKPTKIPLWHSGLVVTVANFKENEILSLNHLLNEQRVELGYASQSFLFSGGDVNLVMEIVNFILDHVISCSLKGWVQGDRDTLKDLILVSDIPSLLAGALDAIYPSGYPTERQCINSGTTKCDYKPKLKRVLNGIEFDVDSLLRFNRTIWTDTSRITLEQKQHMGMPMGSVERADVLGYQKKINIVENLSEDIAVGEGLIRFSFQQPTLTTYEQSGSLWITGVIDMVDRAMGTVDADDAKARAKKRRQYIKNYEYVLRFQKHAPWVKTIAYGKSLGDEDTIIVSDVKTLFGLMGELSQDEDLVTKATSAIDKYREASQITFAGIPNYTCPSCGSPQHDPEKTKHGLIPMNMVQYFFIIMAWRLGRIAQVLRES